MKTFTLIAFVALVAARTLVAQAPPAPPTPCPPSGTGDVRFACGQQGPEDLVVVPGSQWVVASAYGGTGGVNLIRVRDRMSIRAYPSADAKERLDAKTYNTCPGPPDAAAKAKFLTHGLYLQTGTGAVHKLFVVAHGSRESVEVFEIDMRTPTPTLTWIGCAVAPNPIGLNSVRALADGGFIATNFLPRGQAIEELMTGKQNGELWEWHTATGWQKVPGSETSGANGIELSDDGKLMYVAAWGSQSFFRLTRGQTPPSRQEIKLGFRVDNIRWARDGSILAGGQGGTPEAMVNIVVKVDPRTLAVKDIIRSPNIGGFSAGTVAVEVGDDLWIGSYIADRIAIFKAPK
jgi:hypothetical protein